MKPFALFVLIPAMLATVLTAKKMGVLTEIGKPSHIEIDDSHLYVSEPATVYIYSLEDFKLLKKFGQKGQGPQEFQVLPHIPIGVDAGTGKLVITSIRKVSYYTKEGEFLKEVRGVSLALRLKVFGDKFLGWSQARKDGVLYNTINIFGRRLNKIQEVYRQKDPYQAPGKGYRVLSGTFKYQAYKGKILLPGAGDASIDVFDTSMKKLFTIRLPQERRKVDAEFKQTLTHYFKTNAETKNIYDRMLKPLIFPSHFPLVADFFADGDRIYVMTWKKMDKGNEFFIYGMDGTFEKRLVVPIQYESQLSAYPTMVRNGKLYQLVESEEEGEWELHVTEIS